MSFVSTNWSKLCDCLFLLLLVFPLFPPQCNWFVGADEPIDSTCKSANEYLDAMYRCRGRDFQVISFCASQSAHELSCNRSNRIAIFNASIGRSDDHSCSQTEDPFSVRSFASTNPGSECCLLQTVETRCHGKHRCIVSSEELARSTDGRLCATGNQPPQRIMIVFICVSPKMFKELKKDASSPDVFCDGHSDTNNDDSTDGLRRKSVDDVNAEGRSTITATIATTAAGPPQAHHLPPTEASELSSVDVGDVDTSQSGSTHVNRSGGSLDWIWSMVYIRDNMDRFLIYLFLSIAVGVILVLLVVIVGLCFGRYWRNRSPDKTKEVSHHTTQSSTQTNDVTTSLVASNQTPGIEMIHYAQTDSLHAVPGHPRSNNNNTNGNPSMGGNSVRFATEDPTQPGIRRTENGGSSYLNIPRYQIASSSTDSVDGGDRMAEHDDYPSNTLGRFYTNPYRHDSFRADGYRTLQYK